MKPGDLVRINPRRLRGEVLHSDHEYNSPSVCIAQPGELLVVLQLWSHWAGFDGVGTHYTQVLTPQGITGWLPSINLERV